MSRPAATVARFALVEALRSGLPWLAAAALLATVGLAVFLAQVAIIEARAVQASVAATLLRACAVFLVAAHVATSVAREASDRVLELALALPVPRSAYFLGKLGGFAAIGVLMALLYALPLLLWASPLEVAAWGVSLAAECALVAALALFFASAIAQGVAAIACTAALYLLARAIGAIQAIASGPAAPEAAAGHAARWAVDAVALLLPRLDAVTRSDWLLYGTPGGAEFARALGGLAIYFVLLAAAGLFDFSRRNL